MNGFGLRGSRWRIDLSREPVLKMEEFQEMEPTLFECPWIVLIFLSLLMSQRWTSPLLVPTVKCGPLSAHPTDVTVSLSPRSHNFVTLLLFPFQR